MPLPYKITDHFLVPKHEIVSKEEASNLLKQYGLTEDKLPRIPDDDPIVQEIAAKKGNVLKITRKSHTAGETIYFRIVD